MSWAGRKGDKNADKFFNVTIPRLNSAEVQSKSDAELKEIIIKGTRAMDPVEIDESGFRHRLPPQLRGRRNCFRAHAETVN